MREELKIYVSYLWMKVMCGDKGKKFYSHNFHYIYSSPNIITVFLAINQLDAQNIVL